MKEAFQKLENGYLFTDLLFIASVIYFFKTKNYHFIPVAIIVVGIVMYITMFHHGTRVINKSGKTIKAKDEGSAAVYDVADGNFKNHIDGILVDGTVYKLPDGVRATVTKHGKIFVSSLFGTLIYKLSGGALKAAPDAAWNPLFEAK